MTKENIITAIEEGILEQEFRDGLPPSDEVDEALKEYVDDFILTLRELENSGHVEGTHHAILEGKLISRNLGDIRLL